MEMRKRSATWPLKGSAQSAQWRQSKGGQGQRMTLEDIQSNYLEGSVTRTIGGQRSQPLVPPESCCCARRYRLGLSHKRQSVRGELVASRNIRPVLTRRNTRHIGQLKIHVLENAFSIRHRSDRQH